MPNHLPHVLTEARAETRKGLKLLELGNTPARSSKMPGTALSGLYGVRQLQGGTSAAASEGIDSLTPQA